MKTRTLQPSNVMPEQCARRIFLRRISGGVGGALYLLYLRKQPLLTSVEAAKSQKLLPQLTPCFRDTFNFFDEQKWQIWRGQVEGVAGRARVSAATTAKPGPGVLSIAGFASTGKLLNP